MSLQKFPILILLCVIFAGFCAAVDGVSIGDTAKNSMHELHLPDKRMVYWKRHNYGPEHPDYSDDSFEGEIDPDDGSRYRKRIVYWKRSQHTPLHEATMKRMVYWKRR
ncbi:uncharacterized protein DEA37_0006289 [Paragonimus westermani]|uniref:Uncharacterized protein n=1 Tax=Paragonimus westermani TaxID=34504 RepID=A0A5J4NP41_9TREM|nr:uncharacterized protein DEA37_0006289 [Paragonimus westermani]